MVSGLYLTLIVLAGNALSQPVGEKKSRVVIVGAGVSGYAAAISLLANNFSDFVVLEASDRIGGRIHTVEFGGIRIDKGAEFVHGEVDNVVYELVSPHDLLASYGSLLGAEKLLYAGPTGHMYNSTSVDALLDQVIGFFSDDFGDFNGSLAQCFNPRMKELFEENEVGSEMAEALSHLANQLQGVYSGADSLQEVGALGSVKYVENEGDLRWKWKSRGYKTIFDILSKKFPNPSEELPVMDKIHFGKAVRRVQRKEDTGEVVVGCADGTSYSADHVLVTMSLGVLKKCAKEMFHPPLPQNKTDAIRTLGIGCVGKVFLLFPSRWWPTDINGIVPLFSQKQLEDFKNNSTNGYWTAYTNGIYPVMNHDRMFSAWYSGQSCRTMESLTDDQVVEAHMELLNALVGKHFQIPRPESILRTNWASYRYTLGAYSYPTVDSDRLNITREHLSDPLWHGDKPLVMFAGEATHPQYWSTVHGALASGRREAARLLEYFKAHM